MHQKTIPSTFYLRLREEEDCFDLSSNKSPLLEGIQFPELHDKILKIDKPSVVSQRICEELHLITRDKSIAKYPIETIKA